MTLRSIFAACLVLFASCDGTSTSGDEPSDPSLDDVKEPGYVADVQPERLALESYSPSNIGGKYYPIKVKVGPSSPGEYTERKTRILSNIVNFDDSCSRREYVSRTDIFGGSTTMEQQKVTGRFYVTRINGRFWFVDPLGNPWYLRGIASLTTEGATSGRNKAAFSTKFGDDRQVWLAATREELAMTGIHATCAFLKDDSAIRQYNSDNPKEPLVIAPSLSFLSSFRKQYYPEATLNTDLCTKSEWATFCETYAESSLAPYKGKRWVLGVFSDNEISFTDDGAEAYYKGIHDAIKKFDPRMLYLGSRLHGSAKTRNIIVKAAGKWCDAVSVNYYGDWSPALTVMMTNWANWAPDTPFIITEFYTKGADSGLPNTGGAGLVVPDQYSRAYAYQHFTLGLLEAKHVAGWVWFRYQDDTDTDPEASNKGLYDNDYNIYPFLAKYMRAVNYNVYRLTDYFD